jgi:predicted alpha/beta-hydrolase family hydrolase
MPDAPNHNALVLTHGAGSNAQAPLLVALAETFSAAGFIVLRCDLPYRQTRSFGPPGPGDAARDRSGLRNAIASIKTTLGAPLLADFARSGNYYDAEGAPSLSRSLRQGGGFDPDQSEKYGNVFLGGHSYGGRQSSMLCAELSKEQPDLVAGLLLLSYPLHPPRKSEQQRTQHLPNLHTPTLFIHGTRDPFGSIAEMEQALKMIPARTKLIPVEGAGHDLGFKGKAKKEELSAQILTEFSEFLKGVSS